MTLARSDIKDVLKRIVNVDKTFYNSYGKNKLNRFGEAPSNGKRFATPRELAAKLLMQLEQEDRDRQFESGKRNLDTWNGPVEIEPFMTGERKVI